MKSTHAGMGVTESDRNEMMGHFLAALKRFSVPQKETDEPVAIVATTKAANVEKP